MFVRILIFSTLIILIELYFLQAVKTFTQDFSSGKRTALLYTTYILATISILMAIAAVVYPPPNWTPFLRLLSSIMIIIVLCKLIGCTFLLVDDIIRLGKWCISFFKSKPAEAVEVAEGISRLKFLSQLAITFTVVPAVGFIYGMVSGAYKYRVHKVKVPSSKIPKEFDGFKIVQLSDIHTGSFLNEDGLKKAFEIVAEQNADLILFTGDLVNNEAKEVEGYEHLFSSLKAPHGVYSVLGNHDYGDYIDWGEGREGVLKKQANLQALKDKQKAFGWRLLMNEHLPIEKNGAKIGLLGIENWGGNMRFPRYGKMKDAYEGAEQYPFKILMSHDPSHWDMQVVLEYPDVDLTLSGHTHGMQLGIEIPGIKWSPAKWLYKNWAGLYKMDKQFLYVNRGLGFLGYPGRLGIWPEITVLELQCV